MDGHPVHCLLYTSHILFEKGGIRPGDKVALCSRNTSNWGIVFLATLTYGAVAVPILNEFKPDTIHHIINHSGTQMCIRDSYKSESETNFNNRSIAWLLKNFNRIYDDPNMSLDLYTRQCSMGVTAKQLSIAACTIANNGLNPVTKQQVFDPSLSPKITSLIATVGFYEHTGDWLSLIHI